MTNLNETVTANETETTTTAQIGALTFGVEIETYGLGKLGCANAIVRVLGGTARGDYYGATAVDGRGRTWKLINDASINGVEPCEVVSPVLTMADMDDLQNVVRSLRTSGARVNESCGLHVHVGLTSMATDEAGQVRAIRNLCNIVHKHEAHINVAVGCGERRQASWAKPLPTIFVETIRKARTLDEIASAYYAMCGRFPTGNRNEWTSARCGHYAAARYSGLNLHNVWFRSGNARTVEFRLFDATLHAGKVRAYVTFCVAMAARAANVSRTSYARREGAGSALGREQCRWFVSKLLGLVGDRYATVRRFVCDEHFDVNGARIAVATARRGAGYRAAA